MSDTERAQAIWNVRYGTAPRDARAPLRVPRNRHGAFLARSRYTGRVADPRPDDAVPFDERVREAAMKIALGLPEEGLAELERLVRENPGSPRANAALAYARVTLGDWGGALASADVVLGDAAAPPAARIEAHLVRARALGKRAAPGDLDAAVPDLDAALADRDVLLSLLEHREDVGALADAPAFAEAVLAALERWTTDEPACAEAWFALAREHLERRRLDASVEAGKRVVSLSPHVGAGHYVLACALALRGGLGDREVALGHAADAVRFDPELRDAVLADPDLASLRDDPTFAALGHGAS